MPSSNDYTIIDMYNGMVDLETAALASHYPDFISETDEPQSANGRPHIFRLPPVINFTDYTALGTEPLTNLRSQKKTFTFGINIIYIVEQLNSNASGRLSAQALQRIKEFYALYQTQMGMTLNGTVDRFRILTAEPVSYTLDAVEYYALQFASEARQYLTFTA